MYLRLSAGVQLVLGGVGKVGSGIGNKVKPYLPKVKVGVLSDSGSQNQSAGSSSYRIEQFPKNEISFDFR